MSKLEKINKAKIEIAEKKLSNVSMLTAQISGTLKAYLDEPVIVEQYYTKVPHVSIPLETLKKILEKASICSMESSNFYGDIANLWQEL